MTGASRIIGIIVCLALIIVALVAFAPAAVEIVKTAQGNGTRLGMAFDTPASDEEIDQTIRSLTERLEKLGIKDAIVERSKAAGENVQVLLPPGADVARAKLLLTNVGLLELKLVAKDTQLPYNTKEEAEAAAKNLAGGSGRYEVLHYKSSATELVDEKSGWVVVEKPTVITGRDMLEAKSQLSRYVANIYGIDFTLKPEAAQQFAAVTRDHVGNYLAIVLNHEVKSAPTINSEISDHGQITGGFTKQSAEDLALVLGSGALPRPLRIVSEQPVRWTDAYKKPAG